MECDFDRAFRLMATDTKPANVRHIRGVQALTPRSEALRPVRYEGYGPGGAVLLLECRTEDPEHTRARLRRAFREHGGHLGAQGSVAYLFDRVGLLRYAPGVDLERLTRTALAAGAEDVTGRPGGPIEVLTDPEDFETVRAELCRQQFAPLAAEVTERPALAAPLHGEAARRMRGLIETLAALEEVCAVYTNAQLGEADTPAGAPLDNR